MTLIEKESILEELDHIKSLINHKLSNIIQTHNDLQTINHLCEVLEERLERPISSDDDILGLLSYIKSEIKYYQN